MFDAWQRPIHIGLTRTTDCVVEPVSLEDAKLFLRVEHGYDDDLIASLCTAARQKFEADTGRALLTQTWTYALDLAPLGGQPIRLPIGPVASVSSVTAYSTADVGTTVATSVYRLDAFGTPARVVLKDGQSWPSGLRPQSGLVVVFVAGYGATAAAVPDAALMQVRLLISHWYENRSTVSIGNVVTVVPDAYTPAQWRVWA